MARSNRWCFTYNNAQDGWRPEWLPEDMEYIVWELEIAPTTNNLHIQGYVRMKTKRTLATMKRLLGRDTIHLETAKGTEKQNREYCTKEVLKAIEEGREPPENFEEGEYDPDLGGRQGHRSDLDRVREAILSHATLTDIARNHFKEFVKFQSGIKAAMVELQPRQEETERPVTVTWIWGPPRVGKTYRVRSFYGRKCYVVKPGRDPFGTYAGQDVILFDEFNDQSFPIREMNDHLTGYEDELNCRYLNKYANWTKVFIISNSHPDSFYRMEADLNVRQAFFARIHHIVHLESREQELLLI